MDRQATEVYVEQQERSPINTDADARKEYARHKEHPKRKDIEVQNRKENPKKNWTCIKDE